ncbi:hypothetical protein [Allobranchiibius sp. GilTou73]|uniref:hypothetical protein n=1 Tax=Allobranchiibius sp. GilTou73 TaxID=2904523 RepID=UPI001F2D2618|nr:hypothetical protein [Allobranchiibius sp. GilTou73]UIJ33560.1 hypothetical protein LVQ62_10270 [Allobranchiibius sp. GilTou73]
MKIAIFGENPNDTHAIRELLIGLHPHLEAGDLKILRAPPTLNRDAGGVAMRSWVDKAKSTMAAANVSHGPLDCILAHTDADGPDDGSFANKRSTELQTAGLVGALAVVPVQAIESWWLLFPDATESVVASWRGALRRGSYNTDNVNDPKADLIRRTRRKQPRRPYQEADSPKIAAAISATYLDAPRRTSSPSFERFRTSIAGVVQGINKTSASRSRGVK